MSILNMKPQRIQLKRTRGWRMPPNTVKVDRSTAWGNPFVVGGNVDLRQARRWGWKIANPKRQFPNVTESLEMFSAALALDGASLWLLKRDLRGKNLACWCPLDQPCHADVLLEMANES
jgi:Domain of unknown function (DUF4326)